MGQNTLPYGAGNILMIVYAHGEIDDNAPNWRIQIENNPNVYPFMGETEAEQADHIQALGEYMTEFQDNPELLYDQIGVLVDFPPGMTSEEAVDLFFGHTTMLQYRDEVIYEIPEGANALIDTMVDAGEHLLEALVA